MNILLWILQILLALHTIMGAVWKFSNSEQSVPALNAIPHGGWMVMSFIEILCSLALVLPLFKISFSILAPFAALVIAAEMFLFSGLLLSSGNIDYGSLIYWLVVAAICVFIAYGRLVMKPQ